ncbi:MAG: 30S ribosomal protein S2, partial [Flavobacteriales bacterium CG_4_10_14_0_8_um_filter_32_5]
IKKEHIAIAEAKKLGIPTFALVDTNSDPTLVDFAIPGNDDASSSIDKIISIVAEAVTRGLADRKKDKEATKETKEKVPKEATKEEVTSEETKA